MNKREYLRSLGFTVGERGRFSAEMQAALKGMSFVEEHKAMKEAEVAEEVIYPKLRTLPKRTDGVCVYTAELHNGVTIRFDTCADCKESVVYCQCSNPQPPEWLRDEVAIFRKGE